MANRRALLLLAKGAFGLGVVALLLWRFDLRAVGRAAGAYRWPDLLLALSLMAASWPLAAWRWKLFVPQIAFARLLHLTLIGQFYSVVLPGQLAGEVVKSWRIARGNADAERVAASVLLDRVLATLALLLVAGAGLLFSARGVARDLAPWFALLAAVLTLALFCLHLAPVHRLVQCVSLRLGATRAAFLATPLMRLVGAWRDFGRAPLRLTASLLTGVAFQLLGVAIFALLARDLGIEVTVADWAWIFGVVSLALLLPVSLGGVGLREGALLGCLALFGVPPERALALSFGVLALTLSGAALGGLLELRGVLRNASAAPTPQNAAAPRRQTNTPNTRTPPTG